MPATSTLASARAAALAAAAFAIAPAANAQSLFQRRAPAPVAPAPTQPTPADGSAPQTQPAQTDQSVAPTAQPPTTGALTRDRASTFIVVPPKPKTFQKHDKIEIIVNQTSLQKTEASLETKKKFDLKAELSQFPSLKKLLEDATLGDGIGADGPNVGLKNDSSFKGDGTAERKDRFTARVSAMVIDVKPNGLLVVEAREVQQFDEETKTLVVSGVCDPKDVTTQGTVQSTQLAQLVIKVTSEGQVKSAAEKGFIPRIFDAIFNF
jgi:flagellar L-ring protein precursor FlgH